MLPENPDLNSRVKVLVVDDSRIQSALLEQQLVQAGYAVFTAADLGQAEAAIEKDTPAVILIELLRESSNGFETGRVLLEKYPVPCVLLTASGRRTDREWANKIGFAATLAGPLSPALLKSGISAVQGND